MSPKVKIALSLVVLFFIASEVSEMGVQASCSVHAKVSEENRLLGDAGRYPRYHPGPM